MITDAAVQIFMSVRNCVFLISTSETQTKEEPGSVEADGEDDDTVTPGRVKEGCVKVGEVSGVYELSNENITNDAVLANGAIFCRIFTVFVFSRCSCMRRWSDHLCSQLSLQETW